MKDFRPRGLILAAALAVVMLTTLSPSHVLATGPILLTIDINDGVDTPYHMDYFASDPLFTPDGFGTINASIPFTMDTNSGADFLMTYFYSPNGHHLGIGYSIDASPDNPTTFSITATSPTFAGVSGRDAKTVGTLGGSDGLGSPMGSVTGLFPPAPSLPGNSFQASYGSATPTTVFATLANDSAFIADPDNPLYGVTQNFGFGDAPTTGSVSVMRSQWYFSLAAADQSSSTSDFHLVPEPSSLGLLALGSLALLALRRRLRTTPA